MSPRRGRAGCAAFLLAALVRIACAAGEAPAPASWRVEGTSVVLVDAGGTRLRITPYGPSMVRVQAAREGEAFSRDDRYEMVESHRHGGRFRVHETASELRLEASPALRLRVDRRTLAVSWFEGRATTPVLQEEGGVRWADGAITRAFVPDAGEHFTALGHGFFGRAGSIDLKGQRIGRNYGLKQIDQAPLLVPFFLSGKGYGVFVNSTFRNTFDFDGPDGRFEFGLESPGDAARLDYFVIAGPAPADVLRHYVELTGHPRLPPKAMFGLALSDKGHDHDSPTPSDEAWWKRQVAAHRASGLPLDHLVNDNRWRAGGGKRCESRLEWDTGRFADPAEYARWLKAEGLVTTIDVNRCILRFSEGWDPAFNLPEAPGVEFAGSAPDFTNPAMRRWLWDVLYRQALDPRRGYPGDALWIDEFDEMGAAPDSMRLANGTTFGEMRNYWFFLIAKALVQQGWDRSGIDRRPYVWVRGMTAGAQRYATLWSGDIRPDDEEMKQQVRGMQLAGLSGFPFWGHDAGGFHDWDRHAGPDADLYVRWSMGFGSFSPIWKPHGMGPSRWPLDRTAPEQAAASTFARARYELMPYVYSAAHEAAVSGMPMARALLLAYPHEPEAWRRDLEYLWGPDLLVAPRTDRAGEEEVWLPPGDWYDWWHPGQPMRGDAVLRLPATGEPLPVFVRAGALVTTQALAPSTSLADKRRMRLDVYAGSDGRATLYEDDDVTEDWRRHGRHMTTRIRYDDHARRVRIEGARGDYRGAPAQRAWEIAWHGADPGTCFVVNGRRAEATRSADDGSVRVAIPPLGIRRAIDVRACGKG